MFRQSRKKPKEVEFNSYHVLALEAILAVTPLTMGSPGLTLLESRKGNKHALTKFPFTNDELSQAGLTKEKMTVIQKHLARMIKLELRQSSQATVAPRRSVRIQAQAMKPK